MMRVAIFDLGNVIVFFSFRKMLQQMAACTGLDENAVDHEFFKGTLRAQYEAGVISTAELYHAFRKRAPKPFSQEQLLEAMSDIFILNHEIVSVVEALKRQGLRLVLLSNTSEAHFTYLWARYPVLQLFDAKILSYEVGAAKPEPRIYHAALSAAECAPQDCFFTDDIADYVEGARKEGIDAEQFVGVKELRQHLRARGVSVE